MVDEIQSKKYRGNKKLYLSGKTISDVVTVGDSTYQVAAVGPKTVAGSSENNQLNGPI